MHSLNHDQLAALEILKGPSNVFLTGAAGSGKSFLLKHYLKGKDIPILASTGSAAILVGGRTFHSFFGLGIMEGGFEATVERALKNKKLISRLKKTATVVIDEVSMLSGPTLRAAQTIAQKVLKSMAPWGGLRIIAVGDFAQLPPVNPFSQRKEWAFLDPVWLFSEFQPIVLTEMMRSKDTQFLEVLSRVRSGRVDSLVIDFLNLRAAATARGDFTRLFPHRTNVDTYNYSQLQEITNQMYSFKTEYSGKPADIEKFQKNAPISDVLHLKEEALVMIRQNDPAGRWVNGSLGRIEKISDPFLKIRLESGSLIELEKADFTLLDADGEPVVNARNFPVTLAWAMTIHKAQGTTLDKMQVDLRKIWEPGQAYVALSRVRRPQGLFVEGWSPRSIFCDRDVTHFHQSLLSTSYPVDDEMNF